MSTPDDLTSDHLSATQQTAPADDIPPSPTGYQLLEEIGRGGMGAARADRGSGK